MFKEFILEYQEIIFSVVTIIISVIALWVSIYQIRLSNKHQLFDRRLKIYSVFNECMLYVEFIKTEPNLTRISTITDCQNLLLALSSSRTMKECLCLFISDREIINTQKFYMVINGIYDYMNEAEMIFPLKIGNFISYGLNSYVRLLTQCVGYHNFYVNEAKHYMDKDGNILENDLSEEYRKREIQYISDINTEFKIIKNIVPILSHNKFEKKIRKLIKL